MCSIKLAVDSSDVWEFTLTAKQKPPSANSAPQNSTPAARSPTRDKRKLDANDRGPSKTGKEIVAVSEQKQKQMKFRIPAKFVVKCHTPEGDYACVLCCGPSVDYSGVVVLCDDPESLVDHVVKEHRAADIKKEIDIITA